MDVYKHVTNMFVYGTMMVFLPILAAFSNALPKEMKRWKLKRKVSGREHVPKSGPFIVVAVHGEITDPWAIVHALRIGPRIVRWVAGYKLYKAETAWKIFIEEGKENASKRKAEKLGKITRFIMRYSWTIPICREEDGEEESERRRINRGMLKEIEKTLSKKRGIVGVFYGVGINRPVEKMSAPFIKIALRKGAPLLPVLLDDEGFHFEKPVTGGSVKDIQSKLDAILAASSASR